MSDRLDALRLFARVARRASFSAAARELGVPQSTASRTIAKLEREIGAALLVRTTRAVTLTEAGSDFLARIEPILADLEEAEQAARGSGELRGLLRVGIGTAFAIRVVIPGLKPFLDLHPALRIELIMQDHQQDLVAEGVDVAFRIGTLTDSTATARRLKTWRRALVASPAYLATAPALKGPADLLSHAIIVGPQGAREWVFRKHGTAASLRVDGRLKIQAFEGALAAAAAGLGIAVTTLGASRRELADGSLVHVLPEWEFGSVDLYAVFTAGRAAKPSARALVAFVESGLAEI